MDILGKEPRDELGRRGCTTIDPRDTAIVITVAIDTAAVGGHGHGRSQHPPPRCHQLLPAALRLLLPSVCANDDGDTKYENEGDKNDDNGRGRRFVGGA